MSTTDGVGVGSQLRNGTTASQLSLPTFAPVRDASRRRSSHADSSPSDSRRSGAESSKRSRSGMRGTSSIQEHIDEDFGHAVPSSEQRRRLHRSSGGFLLDSTPHSSRISKSWLTRSLRDKKGKRTGNDAEELGMKRRSQTPTTDRSSMIGSSPLSVEVRPKQGESNGTETPSKQNVLTQPPNGHIPGNTTPGSVQTSTPSVGLDSDPAQIVDMALRLSEGRRRQATGRRYVSGEDQGRRVVSAARIGTPRSRAKPQSLQQIISPISRPLTTPVPHTPEQSLVEEDDPDAMQLDSDAEHSSAIEVSRATAMRVEKAKNYLELAYEHRRVLSHLPPIRNPDQPIRRDSLLTASRIYNPLQYARNRKLRIREKNSMNAELEGWHDAEKVRAWVNSVLRSHAETSHDPVECVRLPPINPEKTPTTLAEASPRANQLVRPRRPKSDWVTHPGDLIADTYWLEQGLNKTKIHDRDNNPIFPPNTTFKFSGWRNFTPVEVPQGLQEPTPPPEDSPEQPSVPPLSAAPELPTFTSAHEKQKQQVREKKKRRPNRRESIANDIRDSRRRTLAIFDSSSDHDTNSSSGSVDEGRPRGRKGFPQKKNRFDLPDGDPFSNPIATLTDSDVNDTRNSSEVNLSANHSKRGSVDQSRLIRYLKRNSTARGSFSDAPDGLDNLKRSRFLSSQEDRNDERQPRDSLEYDSTAPGSPANSGFPSIAINLSPPVSRSPSPTKKKLNVLHPFRKHHLSSSINENVEEKDFAARSGKSHSRDASTDKSRDSSGHMRGTSPKSRGPSPFTKLRRESTVKDEPELASLEHRYSTVSRASTRSGNHAADHHRIRGIFKGGRIAELVGNEVSRVGDFILKRDPPTQYRNHQHSGSQSSFKSRGSDTDEERQQNGGVHKTPQRDIRSVSSQSSYKTGERASHESQRDSEAPQYNNPNLPSFTSPFQKDRDRKEKKTDALSPDVQHGGPDHISRQMQQNRSRSKSPRLDRLAPPRLDTSAAQTPAAEPEGRKNSYGFGAALDFSNSQSASRALTDAINKRSTTTSANTSIADVSRHLRASVAGIGGAKRSSTIGKGDIARVQALLLMTAAKAKNITMAHDEIPTTQSHFLVGSVSAQGGKSRPSSPLQVRRRDEHVIAARNLISALQYQSNSVKEKFGSFSNKTVVSLHSELQTLEDLIENALTPRVRAAADSAGELSMKLTTTSTLAIKGLNDNISEAFRVKKRGPFRWVRQAAYGAIEWAVVGLLWIIWFVVTSIRTVARIITGAIRIGRWLLWVD